MSKVSKNLPFANNIASRKMTMEAMQKDFEYEMAQRITKNLLNQGLISVDEYKKISELNLEKFSPFYRDLIDI